MEFVEFTLAGDTQVYKLTFDFNEVVDAEAVSGCNLFQALAKPREMSAAQMRGLLYACLKPAHPIVLLNEAGDLLSKDMGTVSGALSEALFGDGDEMPKSVEGTKQAA